MNARIAAFLTITLSLAYPGIAPGAFASSLSWDRLEARVDMEPGQEQAEAVFIATNEGSSPVRIARIKTSCGCTGSIVDRKIIQPGESSEIVARFNKGRRQGLNRNRLQVFVDGQEEAVATLTMTVQIPTLVEVNPRIVYWNAGSPRQARTVEVSYNSDYVENVDRLLYDQGQLNVTRDPAPGESDGRFTLSIAPTSYDQVYRGSIRLSGEGPDGLAPSALIHVYVQP